MRLFEGAFQPWKLASTNLMQQCLLLNKKSQFHTTFILQGLKKQKANQRRKQNLKRREELRKQNLDTLADPIIGHSSEWVARLLKPYEILVERKKPNFPIHSIKFPASMETINLIVEKFEKIRASATEETKDFIKLNEVNEFPSSDTSLESNQDGFERLHPLAERLERMSQLSDLRKESIHRIFNIENSNSKTLRLNNKQLAVESFARNERDTGSPEVQAAVYTSRILALSDHCKNHKKDQTGKRMLRYYVHQRQRMLKYLRKVNFDRYVHCIKNLGLTDELVLREVTQ